MHLLEVLQIINIGNKEIVNTLGNIEIIFIYILYCLNIRVKCKFNLIINKIRVNENEPQHVKTNKVTVRPAKTQISLGIRPVRSESPLCA